MVPDKFNMVDMDGIDLIMAQGEEVPGLYNRLVESIAQCRYQCLYNWFFNGVVIPPSYVEMEVGLDDVVRINEGISVTPDDVIHIYSVEPGPVDPEIIPLLAEENGVYNVPSGKDGFNPVTVDVPSYTPVINPISILENGTYTAPSGVDGYSPIVVDVPTGGGIIFPEEAVSLYYSGNLSTVTFTNDGYYAVLGVIDGYSSSSISFSVVGATVIESGNKTSVNSGYGSALTGILLHADAGDSISISGISVSRQAMIVLHITNATVLSSLDLNVEKDRTLSKTIQNIHNQYCFYIAGSTGDNSVSVNFTTTDELKWSAQATSPVRIHKYGAFEGTDEINCTVTGSSYATNYAMFFGVD